MTYRVIDSDKVGISHVVDADGNHVWQYVITSQAHMNCAKLNAAYAAGRAAGEWRTGVPAKSGWYLATVERNGHTRILTWLYHGPILGWFMDEGTSRVLAWQPLPPPYQAASGGGEG